MRLARKLLTVEDALRFILFPRNPIDFACVNVAVASEPGRVDVVTYLLDGCRPNETFFELMLGAAEEFMGAFGLSKTDVSMRSDGRQAHYIFNVAASRTIGSRIRRAVSRGVYTLYTLALIRSSYPELVMGRKLFEEQLVKHANLERHLSSTEQLFERRMDHVDDVIAEIDSLGCLVYVSPNLERLVGTSGASLMADPTRVVHRDDYARVKQSIDSAIEHPGDGRIADFRIRDSSERVRWVEITFSSLTTPEGAQHLIGVARDVTDRRNHFEERQRLDRQLEHTQRLEMVGVMAGGIAHDFNNLLTPIVGQADLARAELQDRPVTLERIDTIVGAAEKAADLVRQLMVYAGTEPASFAVIDLSRETQALLELTKTNISPKVQLQVSLDPDAFVRGDVSQLRQVIMNLIVNASEAIGDRPGTIEVSVVVRDDTVTLSVRDDGVGMDQATEERIFEPFFTTKFAGRGLGLSAVRSIVNAHQGELVFETELGEGTHVRMVLESAASQVPGDVPEPDYRKRSGRILLVDDEEAVRTVGKAMLERFGYEVDLACDGAQALSKLQGGHFDALIVDLMMPKVDGREVLAATRELDPHLPFIMASGYGMDQFEADANTLFIGKPYRMSDLGDALRELMDRPSENPRLRAAPDGSVGSGNV